MNTLYVITGPAGVGKSTISRAIAESLQKSAVIEGDDIYNQVVGGYVLPWLEGNHLDVMWKIVFDSIKTYISAGFDVVLNYIISPEQIAMLKETFPGATIRFAVLIVDDKTLLARDMERPENCRMGDRCLDLLRELKAYDYGYDCYLDSTDLTIPETVSRITADDRFVISC